MPWYFLYPLIFALLLLLELIYFQIAAHFNIVDEPHASSSHKRVVLRGGGIIFTLALLVWFAFFGFRYPLFVAAVALIACVSFRDDVKSLTVSFRLVFQILAMALMLVQLFLLARSEEGLFWDANPLILTVIALVALFVFVGATNIYNFMDGINGITAEYSLGVLLVLFLLNRNLNFVEPSLLIVMALSVLVFGIFNCRPADKAKCFAGDVGSVGIAFILLFVIARLILRTQDITWMVLLLVYGVDGVMTILHRIKLHENLGTAHRKHAFQLMANELGMPQLLVSSIYLTLQLAVSLGFVYLCPLLASCWSLNLVAVHWIYLAVALVILVGAYVVFVKKYYRR